MLPVGDSWGRSGLFHLTYPGQAGEMPDQVRHDVGQVRHDVGQVRHDVGSEAGADADLGDALHTETQLHETVDYLTHLQADE